MASLGQESTASESQDDPRVRRESIAEADEGPLAYFRAYGRARPGVMALWCFGVGFVLGWRLKPW